MGAHSKLHQALILDVEQREPAHWLACCPRHPARDCAQVGRAYFCGRCRVFYDRTGMAVGRAETDPEPPPAGAGSSLAAAIRDGGADF